MFVVRRAFRNFGKMMAPGSVLEPGSVKRFKSRLKDGHIVEVNEHDFDKWHKYFKDRVGVELKCPEKSEPEKEPEKEPEIIKPAVVVKAR